MRLRVIARLALVGLVAFVALVALPGAASANNPTAPPWLTSKWYYSASSTVGRTGWTSLPQVDVAATDGSGNRVALWFSEPYVTGTTLSVGMRVTPRPVDTTTDATAQYEVRWTYLCLSQTTGALTEGSSSNALSDVFRDPTSKETILGGGAWCSTGLDPVGYRVRVGVYAGGSAPSGFVQQWQGVYFAGDAYTWSETGPSIWWCRSMFGADFTSASTAIVNGVMITALDAGCTEDYITDPENPENPGAEEDSESFAVRCANAPRARWLSFDWLGPWIGHYSECLFAPVGWDPGNRIAAAYDASPVGAVSTALDAIGGTRPTAGCGVVAEGDLLGADIALNSCQWQGYGLVRTLVTAALWIGGGVGAAGMILRSLGIKVLSRGGDDE